MLLPQLPQRLESIAADSQIVDTGLLRILIERVQDVDRLVPRRHGEHSVCAGYVNPDLTHAWFDHDSEGFAAGVDGRPSSLTSSRPDPVPAAPVATGNQPAAVRDPETPEGHP
jgi:hypothetical protein